MLYDYKTHVQNDIVQLPQKGHSRRPQFSAHFCCGQTAGWIKMLLGTKAGRGPGDIVLDRHSGPPDKGARTVPQFSAHMCCSQTAEWIKLPLGTEVGLGLGHIVFGGYPVPPRKGAQQPPLFGPCLLWPNGRPSQQLPSSCCTAHGR